MAPRGRPQKKNTRMDGAIEAVTQWGFDEPSIRKTVNSLLKVYDGEWVFIEETSYKLVIETLLEQQNEAIKMNPRIEDAVPVPNDIERSVALAGGAESSSQAGEDELGLTVVQAATPGTALQRNPCYGWISDDENDSPSILETVLSKKARMIQSMDRRNRKSQWDIMPDQY